MPEETTANPITTYETYKQHFFYPKTHQIAGYCPHFWMKNALFSVCLSCTGLMQWFQRHSKNNLIQGFFITIYGKIFVIFLLN